MGSADVCYHGGDGSSIVIKMVLLLMMMMMMVMMVIVRQGIGWGLHTCVNLSDSC